MEKLRARFSLTIPSDAAKKARTCETKCRSFSFSFSQSPWVFVFVCVWIDWCWCVFVRVWVLVGKGGKTDGPPPTNLTNPKDTQDTNNTC